MSYRLYQKLHFEIDRTRVILFKRVLKLNVVSPVYEMNRGEANALGRAANIVRHESNDCC